MIHICRLVFIFSIFFIAVPTGAFAQCPIGEWRTPTSSPGISEWSQVAFGNGRFIAVATSGSQRVAWSTDGMTWSAPSTTIPSSTWRWVTYGNGMFVVVAYSGSRRVMTSTDGNTWTIVNSTLTNNGAWQSVAFGNGRFVAVANNGTRVITSQNGTSWAAATGVPAGEWATVGYGNGMFVALSFGSNPRAMSSPDGLNWTERTMPAGGWLDVVYGGGQFVAVSWTNNHIATSPDGITWTARSVPDSRQWGAITYTGGHYIVVGGGGSGPNRMMVSSDGIDWIPQPIPHEGQSLSTVTWGNGTLVVTGHDLYPDTPQFFISDCPEGCYMPNGKRGAREWFASASIYKFCDGSSWQNFSYDGTAGSCSVAGQMEWHDGLAAHTICDGTDREILRWSDSSCSLTSEMLSIGESVSNAAWAEEIQAFTIYDNGTKAVAHGRWATNLLTLDISNAPAAPTAIATSSAASGRVDVGELVVRNGYVFAASPQANGAGRIWASPLSNVSTSYSYPTSGSVSGNHMCHALGLAMNDAGTVAFVPAWDSAGASCTNGSNSGSCILNVFDTSDPTDMSAIAHVNLSALSSNGNIYCGGAYFRDDKLFVSFASGPGDGGMMILDVSNPASPSVLGQAWLGGLGNSQFDHMDVSENGNLAILASRTGRVISVDVSNPASPMILDSDLSVPISSWANDVVIVKNYAFVSTNPNYIHAVNISDPANLTLDATISDDMFADVGKMALLGDRIFYTGYADGRFGMLELNCDVENQGPPDLGACSKTAAIDFEPSAPLYKYCDGGNWRPMTPAPCAGTPIVEDFGTTCYDGTVYVGHSPDGDVPMFTTPGDPEFGLPWGPADGVNLGITNWYTGQDNSAALAALGEWVAPASYYCETLNEHGHNDWYLPSASELLLLDRLSGTPAGLDGQYWSSTEVTYDPEDVWTAYRAIAITLPGNHIDWWRGKDDYRGVRCVRRAASPATDPCAGTPTLGTLCADGTIYAGASPDGNRPMYITQDLAPGYYRWGPNGTNTGLTDCTGAQASCDTGYANTVLLAGLGASYEAATYCHNLTIHGHDDWYLPSRNELNRLYENLGPSPKYGFGDWHWSSSERAAGTAWDQDFSDGEQATSGKQDYDYVRCVRKDEPAVTVDPCDPDESPLAGTFCSDGTHYAGTHPTISGARLFTTTVGEGHIPRWSTEAVLTGADSFVDGRANQDHIIANRDISNYPAMLACHDLRAGGYSDWYLPSIAELDLLYSNLVVLPVADPDNPTAVNAGTGSGWQAPSGYNGPLAGSFDTTGSGWYWSSTEGDAANAYDQSFQSGYRDIYGNKTDSGNYNVNRVHCIRRE